MVDLGLVASAATALSSAVDISRAALEIRDGTKVSTAVSQVHQALLEAYKTLLLHNAELLDLQKQHLEATQELAKIRETVAQRGRYSLFELGPGAVVYRVDARPEGPPGRRSRQRGARALRLSAVL